MGLIDFVKNAGAKIFGKDAPKPDPDEGKLNEQRAKLFERALKNMGIEIENLQITAKDDQVTLRGTAKSQEQREKAVLIVGNHAGIARVDDQLEVAEPAAEATYHTVQRGDTLSAIAKKYYGKASKYPVIFEANKPMLTDPDKIYPGQNLRIPPLED